MSGAGDGYSRTSCGIVFRVDGGDDRPWLVLTNPIATDLTVWDELVAELANEFRILRHDTRGHGRSEPPNSSMTLEDYADDILRVMEAAGASRAHLAGVSMGAMTSLIAACMRPEAALSVSYCNAILKANEGYASFWSDRRAAAERDGLEPLMRPTLERWLSSQATDGQRARAGAMFCETTTLGFGTAASALSQLDVSSLHSRLACPIHFIASDEDTAAPVHILQEAANLTRGARFSILKNSAHLSCLEQPIALAQCVRKTASSH